MSDEQLIKKTLSGDVEAYGELVVKYQNRLFNTVFRMVGNQEDAQDIVQEAFLQAFSNLSRFRMSSQFYTWLYRIAFNIAINILQQRKRSISVESLPDDIGESFVDKGESAQEETSRRESAAILWAAINRLPLDYRSPLVLREIENASYEEIAEMLKIPVGTVRSRLHRARIALKEIMQRHRNDL